MLLRRRKMKPIQEKYDEIPGFPTIDRLSLSFFICVPGAYCKQCGEVFALYSYSAIWPNGLDENDKPYYDSCFKCDGAGRL